MLLLKILLQILTALFAALALNLDHVWHENEHKKSKARKWLYFLTAFSFILSIWVLVYDERSVERDKESLNSQLDTLKTQNDLLINSTNDSRREQVERYEELLSANKELQNQLQPFVTLARQKYPSGDVNESLKSLHSDLQKIKERTSALEASNRPRSLSLPQIETLVKELSQYKGTSIGIKYQANDSESYDYARQFRDLFSRAGWTITRVAATSYYAPFHGLEIGVKSDQAPEPALAITSILQLQSIEIKRVTHTGQTESILLRVGQK